MSSESRTMVKVRYQNRIYSIPEQVRKDADDLFVRWISNSRSSEEASSMASYVTEAAKKTQALKEVRAKLSALKSKMDSLPDRVREKYFS